ncbi:MAG TPA: TlyA family RNA methyltransferase [Candidatus Saccharibacteria bacterium]|nr:TlyA family RNA methyltransferase [Candidatus Saccharibacteria bacterium]
MKQRLDQALVARGLVRSRSQAESWIGLGKVSVNGQPARKSGQMVQETDVLKLAATEQYVSRAGLKLASVAKKLRVDFRDAVVLDVGSSTGGFTDYALQHGAKKVVAVDVGTDQLHPSLHSDSRIELHEKTDIRDVHSPSNPLQPSSSEGVTRLTSLEHESGEDGAALRFNPRSEEATKHYSAGAVEPLANEFSKTSAARASADAGSTDARREAVLENSVGEKAIQLNQLPDIVVMDVSFISLREILPHIASLCTKNTQVVAMLKPQFEAGKHQVNKGIIKNDSVRRQILKDFETWVRQWFVVVDKHDSEVAGSKGNRERFYLLKRL